MTTDLRINFGTVEQGSQPTKTFTWPLDAMDSPTDLTGFTITGRSRSRETSAVTTLSGVFTVVDGAARSISWAMSSLDSGTDGTYAIVLKAVDGVDTIYTISGSLVVEENPDVSATQNEGTVGVTVEEAAWLTLALATVPDASDLVSGTDLAADYYPKTDFTSSPTTGTEPLVAVDGGISFGGDVEIKTDAIPTLTLSLDDTTISNGQVTGAIAFYENDGSQANGVVAKVHNVAAGTAGSFGNLVFSTGGITSALSERMRISSLGNVGINEETPLAQLHVNASSATTKGQIIKLAASQTANALEIQDSAGGVLASVDELGQGAFPNIYNKTDFTSSPGAAAAPLTTNATGGITLDTATFSVDAVNNRVGIGTDTPSERLHVYSTFSSKLLFENVSPGSVTTIESSANTYRNRISTLNSDANRFNISYSQNSGATYKKIFSYGTAGIVLLGESQNCSIAASGNVGIGTILPSARIHSVSGTASTIGQIIKLAASQTANALEIQDSAGTVLASVDELGQGAFPNIYNKTDFSASPVAAEPLIADGSGGVEFNGSLKIKGATPLFQLNETDVSQLWRFYSSGGSFIIRDDSLSLNSFTMQPGVPAFFFNIRTNGVTINKSSVALATLDLVCPSSSRKGQIIKLAASHTANALEIQDSAGSVLSSFDASGNLLLSSIKSGATQGAASAAANEVWKTASHATLPDNVLMIGV